MNFVFNVQVHKMYWDLDDGTAYWPLKGSKWIQKLPDRYDMHIFLTHFIYSLEMRKTRHVREWDEWMMSRGNSYRFKNINCDSLPSCWILQSIAVCILLNRLDSEAISNLNVVINSWPCVFDILIYWVHWWDLIVGMAFEVQVIYR